MRLLTESPQTGIITQNPALLEEVNILYGRLYQDNCDMLLKNGWCYQVARELEKLGLEYVEGYFWADNYFGNPGKHSFDHAFTVDREDNIVDLTHIQFNPHLYKPFSEQVLVLTPDNPNWGRYVKNYKYQALDLVRSIRRKILFGASLPV